MLKGKRLVISIDSMDFFNVFFDNIFPVSAYQKRYHIQYTKPDKVK